MSRFTGNADCFLKPFGSLTVSRLAKCHDTQLYQKFSLSLMARGVSP